MNKLKNLTYLVVFTILIFAIKFLLIDRIFPNMSSDASIWFTSGLLLIILGLFVTEKYFTKPMDVIVNVVTLFVVLMTLNDKSHFILYWPLFVYLILISLIAFLSFVLIDDRKDKNFLSQKIAASANKISGFLGSSKMLFSIVFLLSIFSYFVFSLQTNSMINKEQISIIVLIAFWGFIILIEPIDRVLIQPVLNKINDKNQPKLIGKIIKRLNPNIIYVEQTSSSSNLSRGDIAIIDDLKNSSKNDFTYLIYIGDLDSDNKKFLQFYIINSSPINIDKQVYVFKYDKPLPEKITNLADYKNRNSIIGYVYAKSNIDVIKIKMLDGVDEKNELKEGDLVSVNFYKNSSKYQIINVETDFENIDSYSKKGIKIITAQQIGYWRDEKQKFADTGWAPDINTPVYLEDPESQILDLAGGFFRVGIVPRSSYPIYIDLDECITHHVAIIGKTGTGKSRMAAGMIEKMTKNGYKVVVLEVDRSNSQSLSKYINNDLVEERNVGAFDLSTSTKDVISVSFQINPANRTGGTVNLSDIAAGIIDKVIEYQTQNLDKKICIVMEEAYDFIPENSFGKQDFGQPNVSRISQQVLKCRKHNIGFLIITQRTALVTKTILYQCHTIVALQSFDETSKTFMSAYINSKYLESMSILPRFRAIVVGKGSTCDKPVIVDFYDKSLHPENNCPLECVRVTEEGNNISETVICLPELVEGAEK